MHTKVLSTTSGRERGKCSCGKCACTAEYSGVICECPKSVETCKDQNGVSTINISKA